MTLPSTVGREVQCGGWLLAIAIGNTLFGDAVVILLKISRSGLAVSEGSVVRWLSTAALLYAVWRGHRWARWLMVGLLGLGFLLIVMLMPGSGSSKVAATFNELVSRHFRSVGTRIESNV